MHFWWLSIRNGFHNFFSVQVIGMPKSPEFSLPMGVYYPCNPQGIGKLIKVFTATVA